MPEKNISYCVPTLQLAWRWASTEFIKRYPDRPKPILTCTYRSNEEQADLYAKGRTKPGKIVTQIKSGGKHNQSPAQAYDIGFKKMDGSLDWTGENFKLFAAITKEKYPQVVWGGNWKMKDMPHFEI